MRFTSTKLSGVFLIEFDRLVDERGFFARSFDVNVMRSYGLVADFPQHNVSFSASAGTLRGLHFQAEPHGEVKIVRCTRGKILDIIVDMRPDSTTYLQHIAIHLDESVSKSLYVPTGCAHGFNTLSDNCELHYMMGSQFHAESARGIRWNDPKLEIAWPPPPAHGRTISTRDLAWPLL